MVAEQQTGPFRCPTRSDFKTLWGAVNDVAAWERVRLQTVDEMIYRGRMHPHDDWELMGWRQRTAYLREAADILEVMVPHETVIRELDQRFALVAPAKIIVRVPAQRR